MVVTSMINELDAFQCQACGHRWPDPPSPPAPKKD